MDEGDVLAIVFGMAVYAGSPGSFLGLQGRVQTATRIEPGADFLMALQALQFRRPLHQIMTAPAMCSSAEEAVSLRERSGRNLSVGAGYAGQEAHY